MEKKLYGSAAESLVCADNVKSGGISTRIYEDKPAHVFSHGYSCLQLADDDFGESSDRTESGLRSRRSQPDCGKWINRLRKQPKSLSEEMRYRDCLMKALTVCCKEITEYTVTDSYEIDEMISENCIVGDDKMYIDATNIGTMQRTRRLLSLVLLRDYRTLLAFLSSLLLQNEHVVAPVLREFDNCLNSQFTKPQKCTLCHLQTRVDMSIIVDELLSYDDDWLPFYIKVSQTEYFGPNKEFWQELIGRVNAGVTHERVAELILTSLRKCGFHSDICTMVQEDRQKKRNCFICRCSDMLPFGNSEEQVVEGSSALQTPSTLIYERKMDSFGKTSDVGQSLSNDETDQLHHYYKDHNAWPPKAVHVIANVNQENTDERSSEKIMLDKTKDKDLQITLKGKQYLPYKRNVRQSMRSDSIEDETAEIRYSSHSEKYDYQTDLLKPYTNGRDYKMETLKKVERSGEFYHNDAMSNTEPATSEKHLIQMELLKDDTFKQDDEEMKSENDWSVSSLASLQGSVNDFEWEVTDRSRTYHPSKTGEETDHESCEHQMALLKIGIPEYENDRDSGFSLCSSMQSDGDTCSEKGSLNDASVTNQELLTEKENSYRTNQVSELGPETVLLNLLIVFTFMICFFSHIVQTFHNIF